MRAAIDGATRALVPEDQRLFRHLAVFEGGFTIDAAVAVDGGAARGRQDGSDESPPSAFRFTSRSTGSPHLSKRILSSCMTRPMGAPVPDSGDLREYGIERLTRPTKNRLSRQPTRSTSPRGRLRRRASSGPRGREMAGPVRNRDRKRPRRAELATGSPTVGDRTALRLCNALGDFWGLRGYRDEAVAGYDRHSAEQGPMRTWTLPLLT